MQEKYKLPHKGVANAKAFTYPKNKKRKAAPALAGETALVRQLKSAFTKMLASQPKEEAQAGVFRGWSPTSGLPYTVHIPNASGPLSPEEVGAFAERNGLPVDIELLKRAQPDFYKTVLSRMKENQGPDGAGFIVDGELSESEAARRRFTTFAKIVANVESRYDSQGKVVERMRPDEFFNAVFAETDLSDLKGDRKKYDAVVSKIREMSKQEYMPKLLGGEYDRDAIIGTGEAARLAAGVGHSPRYRSATAPSFWRAVKDTVGSEYANPLGTLMTGLGNLYYAGADIVTGKGGKAALDKIIPHGQYIPRATELAERRRAIANDPNRQYGYDIETGEYSGGPGEAMISTGLNLLGLAGMGQGLGAAAGAASKGTSGLARFGLGAKAFMKTQLPRVGAFEAYNAPGSAIPHLAVGDGVGAASAFLKGALFQTDPSVELQEIGATPEQAYQAVGDNPKLAMMGGYLGGTLAHKWASRAPSRRAIAQAFDNGPIAVSANEWHPPMAWDGHLPLHEPEVVPGKARYTGPDGVTRVVNISGFSHFDDAGNPHVITDSGPLPLDELKLAPKVVQTYYRQGDTLYVNKNIPRPSQETQKHVKDVVAKEFGDVFPTNPTELPLMPGDSTAWIPGANVSRAQAIGDGLVTSIVHKASADSAPPKIGEHIIIHDTDDSGQNYSVVAKITGVEGIASKDQLSLTKLGVRDTDSNRDLLWAERPPQAKYQDAVIGGKDADSLSYKEAAETGNLYQLHLEFVGSSHSSGKTTETIQSARYSVRTQTFNNGARSDGGTVIVAGSRGIADKGLVKELISGDIAGRTVLTGGARGIDTIAHEVAKEAGAETKVMNADWDKHGRGAGYRRNEQMLGEATGVIAIWDGKSSGTKHMIEIARKKGIPVTVHIVEQTQKAGTRKFPSLYPKGKASGGKPHGATVREGTTEGRAISQAIAWRAMSEAVYGAISRDAGDAANAIDADGVMHAGMVETSRVYAAVALEAAATKLEAQVRGTDEPGVIFDSIKRNKLSIQAQLTDTQAAEVSNIANGILAGKLTAAYVEDGIHLIPTERFKTRPSADDFYDVARAEDVALRLAIGDVSPEQAFQMLNGDDILDMSTNMPTVMYHGNSHLPVYEGVPTRLTKELPGPGGTRVLVNASGEAAHAMGFLPVRLSVDSILQSRAGGILGRIFTNDAQGKGVVAATEGRSLLVRRALIGFQQTRDAVRAIARIMANDLEPGATGTHDNVADVLSSRAYIGSDKDPMPITRMFTRKRPTTAMLADVDAGRITQDELTVADIRRQASFKKVVEYLQANGADIAHLSEHSGPNVMREDVLQGAARGDAKAIEMVKEWLSRVPDWAAEKGNAGPEMEAALIKDLIRRNYNYLRDNALAPETAWLLKNTSRLTEGVIEPKYQYAMDSLISTATTRGAFVRVVGGAILGLDPNGMVPKFADVRDSAMTAIHDILAPAGDETARTVTEWISRILSDGDIAWVKTKKDGLVPVKKYDEAAEGVLSKMMHVFSPLMYGTMLGTPIAWIKQTGPMAMAMALTTKNALSPVRAFKIASGAIDAGGFAFLNMQGLKRQLEEGSPDQKAHARKTLVRWAIATSALGLDNLNYIHVEGDGALAALGRTAEIPLIGFKKTDLWSRITSSAIALNEIDDRVYNIRQFAIKALKAKGVDVESMPQAEAQRRIAELVMSREGRESADVRRMIVSYMADPTELAMEVASGRQMVSTANSVKWTRGAVAASNVEMSSYTSSRLLQSKTAQWFVPFMNFTTGAASNMYRAIIKEVRDQRVTDERIAEIESRYGNDVHSLMAALQVEAMSIKNGRSANWGTLASVLGSAILWHDAFFNPVANAIALPGATEQGITTSLFEALNPWNEDEKRSLTEVLADAYRALGRVGATNVYTDLVEHAITTARASASGEGAEAALDLGRTLERFTGAPYFSVLSSALNLGSASVAQMKAIYQQISVLGGITDEDAIMGREDVELAKRLMILQLQNEARIAVERAERDSPLLMGARDLKAVLGIGDPSANAQHIASRLERMYAWQDNPEGGVMRGGLTERGQRNLPLVKQWEVALIKTLRAGGWTVPEGENERGAMLEWLSAWRQSRAKRTQVLNELTSPPPTELRTPFGNLPLQNGVQ